MTIPADGNLLKKAKDGIITSFQSLEKQPGVLKPAKIPVPFHYLLQTKELHSVDCGG